MANGSGHDPHRQAERDLSPDVVFQPGWCARAWARARRAWRWIRRKHEPISEGIEASGRGWTRAARTAARIGRSLTKMGTVIERNGAILAEGRARARRLGRNLVPFGGGMTKFGNWLTNPGRSWAPLGENIENIGEQLGELDIAPLPPEELPEQLSESEPVQALPPARPREKPSNPLCVQLPSAPKGAGTGLESPHNRGRGGRSHASRRRRLKRIWSCRQRFRRPSRASVSDREANA